MKIHFHTIPSPSTRKYKNPRDHSYKVIGDNRLLGKVIFAGFRSTEYAEPGNSFRWLMKYGVDYDDMDEARWYRQNRPCDWLALPLKDKNWPRSWLLDNQLQNSIGLIETRTLIFPFFEARALLRHVFAENIRFPPKTHSEDIRDVAIYARIREIEQTPSYQREEAQHQEDLLEIQRHNELCERFMQAHS